jgi:drug/metabolite transporter (DMT)-like permease
MFLKADKPIPPRLVAGLMAAIVIDTVLQLVWKQSALSLPATFSVAGLVGTVLHQPLIGLVVLLFAAQMINWLRVLEDADVSFAMPITALSYVTIAGFSALILHEHLTLFRMAGITLILGGVFLVSRSGYNTQPAGDAE